MHFLRHVKKPGWGIGRVLRTDDVNIEIYFEAVGPKKLRRALAELEDIPDEQVHASDLLRHLKPDEEGRYAAPPLSFDDMVDNFRRWIGGGFDHPKYFEWEREYKDKAVALAAKLLSSEELERQLNEGDYHGIITAHKKIVNATNLISRFEKAKLASIPEGQYENCARALCSLLHGEEQFDSRFDKVVDVFAQHGVATWPTCTYALFFLRPHEQFIVKPLFVKRAAEALGYELGYKAFPDAATYRRVRQFTGYVAEKLSERDMPPRDMIDVQSFIWYGAGGADALGG